MIARDVMTDEALPTTVTAGGFSALVEEFDHQKALQHDEKVRAALEMREASVRSLIDHHIDEENWIVLVKQAESAAKAGLKEMLLLRFPSELCSDRGRAINSLQPDWAETLRGEASEIYIYWKRDLQPNGFRLVARVLDFPGGILGDIGLTLAWGE